MAHPHRETLKDTIDEDCHTAWREREDHTGPDHYAAEYFRAG